MKTIVERAKEYSKGQWDELTALKAYIAGAMEQKAIDDAERVNQVLMGKGSAINYYNQGYHDAIENACDWLDTYLMEIGYPDDWLRDSPNIEGGRKRFIKAMEKL